jgi:signal transduction histidine kinase
MVSSLRTRLWLSYAVLILVALSVVAVGLVIALQRNPLLYRQTVTRIYLAGSAISFRLVELPKITADRVDKILLREAEARSLRLAILNADGSVLLEAGQGSAAALPRLPLPLISTEDDPNQAKLFRDAAGIDWLYTLDALENGRYLLTTAPRPVLRPRDIFRDEVLGPFMQAALVALLLAAGLALFIGQWISNPLKRMAAAARKMGAGEHQVVPVEGPREVKQLGEALNEMSHQVQISQQSQREFVANVSHELKTPLTSIQGFAQAILDGTVQDPAALQQAAGVIYNESNRMHRLVLDLLSLARLEAGTADLQRTPLDLTDLLKSIVHKFSLQAQHVQVSVNTDLAASLPIVGDADRLTQVFTNLLDNALKFTPAGGQVSIRAAQENGSAVVSVADTGAGIALEDQPRIFERFYQVDKSRKGGTGRGVGLGLPIAAQIVAAHGGRISLESQPGHGSKFTIALPLARPDDPTFNLKRSSF